MRETVLLTCEHGGNHVPRAYAPLFVNHAALLESHRGWDPGTLELGRFLRKRFGWPLVASTQTRLLIDLNRSEWHPGLFSEVTRDLPAEERDRIVAQYYRSHRKEVHDAVAAERSVLHLALHSFTPVWKGHRRATDIGLLHDPARPRERAFCLRWQRILRRARPDLHVHLNRPYRGWTDGLVTALRARFGDQRYAGIELEISQRFPLGDAAVWRTLCADLAATLENAL
jgi:predicted N-formylglutamate amidohydrolase